MPQDNVGCSVCYMGQRGHTGFLQGVTCSNFEDGSEFCIVVDDKGEDFKVYLDHDTCSSKVSVSVPPEKGEDHIERKVGTYLGSAQYNMADELSRGKERGL